MIESNIFIYIFNKVMEEEEEDNEELNTMKF